MFYLDNLPPTSGWRAFWSLAASSYFSSYRFLLKRSRLCLLFFTLQNWRPKVYILFDTFFHKAGWSLGYFRISFLAQATMKLFYLQSALKWTCPPICAATSSSHIVALSNGLFCELRMTSRFSRTASYRSGHSFHTFYEVVDCTWTFFAKWRQLFGYLSFNKTYYCQILTSFRFPVKSTYLTKKVVKN